MHELQNYDEKLSINNIEDFFFVLGLLHFLFSSEWL